MQAKFAALLALVAAATAIPTRLSSDSDAFNVTRREPSTSKKVIVQMFGWNWDSIAAECTNFLGPEGYGFVQGSFAPDLPIHDPSIIADSISWISVSPPSEHITGSQWWTDYQPVSYTLTSKRGNRAQFQKYVLQSNPFSIVCSSFPLIAW
jgi:hypothetical protein